MTILERVGSPAVYEQLAEECAELAQAAVKMSRYLRGENPPAKGIIELTKDLIEEATDVKICMDILHIEADPEIEERKYVRWHQRLDRKEGDHE